MPLIGRNPAAGAVFAAIMVVFYEIRERVQAPFGLPANPSDRTPVLPAACAVKATVPFAALANP